MGTDEGMAAQRARVEAERTMRHHQAQLAEIRRRVEARIKKPLGWCRDERLRLGKDLPIMRVKGHLVVVCVEGIHRGCWAAWKPSGELHAIGSAAWVRRRVHQVVTDAGFCGRRRHRPRVGR